MCLGPAARAGSGCRTGHRRGGSERGRIVGRRGEDEDDVRVADVLEGGGLVPIEDADPFLRFAEALGDDEAASHPGKRLGEFGGAAAGGGEDGELRQRPGGGDRRAEIVAVGTDDLGVVPRQADGRERRRDGGRCGGHPAGDAGGSQPAQDPVEAGIAAREDERLALRVERRETVESRGERAELDATLGRDVESRERAARSDDEIGGGCGPHEVGIGGPEVSVQPDHSRSAAR